MAPVAQFPEPSCLRTLAAVLVVLVVALAGAVSRPARAAAQESMTVKNYGYSKPALVIDVGTEVTWTAIQGDHTVTSDGGSFDGLIAQDYTPHSFSYTFTKPGKYTYHCDFHWKAKDMTGVIEVRGAPGETTTTEPPTTTTVYQPPTTTTTSAPPETTTTTVPPATATTAAPTTTTAAPAVDTSTSTAPVKAPSSNTPATTAPAVPTTAGRPGQAGATAGAATPASTSTSSSAPAPAVTPARTTSPAPDPAAVPETPSVSGPAALAAPAPVPRLQTGAARSPGEGAQDGGGPATLALVLAGGGVLALAGAGGAGIIWRRKGG